MRADSKRDADYSARNSSMFLVLLMHVAIRTPQLRKRQLRRPVADRFVLAALRWYRLWWTRYTPRCRQSPSCSDYAQTAIEDYGWRKGLRMTLSRMGPCL